MPPFPESVLRRTLCHMELFGKLGLARLDAAQRMQFLLARLLVGGFGDCLRTQMLQGEDALYMADRVERESRLALIMEAGAEGYQNIVCSYLEEVAEAQSTWTRQCFAMLSPGGVPRLPAPAWQAGLAAFTAARPQQSRPRGR